MDRNKDNLSIVKAGTIRGRERGCRCRRTGE